MKSKIISSPTLPFPILRPIFIIFMMSIGAVSMQAQDGLIAYDGFDYPADSALEFKDGGSGWAAAWNWRNSIDGKGGIIQNAAYIESGSLSYGDLTATGNHLHLYGDLGSIEMGRAFASVIPGAAGTSTYISFIGQRVGEPANPDDPVYDNPDTPEVETYPWGDNLYPRGTSIRFFNDSNGEIFQIGNYSNQSTNFWAVFAEGARNSDVSFTELAFVVMKINHKGDDTVADDIIFWVNPDLSAGEDIGAAKVVHLDATDINDPEAIVDLSNISWISPWAGNGSDTRPHAEMLVDELRVGTTWDSVTPTGNVIEPTRIIDLAGDLSFGEIDVNTTATATLTITNSGDSDLTVSNITFPDGFSGDWNSGVIAASGSQDVTVTFSPVAVQAYSGDVVVESDATSGTNTIAVSGTGLEVVTEMKWAGFPYDQNGDCNTGNFLGWINVTDAPIILSYTLNTYFYIPESYVGENGSWVFVYNMSSDAPMGGDTTWAGYTVLASQDVETRRFLGWINVIPAPYIYSYSYEYWIYMPEEFVSPAGAWGYFFDRN